MLNKNIIKYNKTEKKLNYPNLLNLTASFVLFFVMLKLDFKLSLMSLFSTHLLFDYQKQIKFSVSLFNALETMKSNSKFKL